MSSDNPSDRFVRILAGVAIIAAIVGGSLYFNAVFSPDAPPPDRELPGIPAARAPTAPASGFSSTAASDPGAAPADADADGGEPVARVDILSGTHGVVLPGAMDLRTRAVVQPDSQRAAVKEALSEALPELERCWKSFEGEQPARSARLLLGFVVAGDGSTSEVEITARHLAEPAINACASDVVKALDISAEAGTSVLWPIELDPEEGATLR